MKKINLNLLLEDLCLCALWISKVHQLIQKFINENEIVSDTFFFQFSEVICKHLMTNEIVNRAIPFNGQYIMLKDKSGAVIIVNHSRDYTVVNGVLYFSQSSFSCNLRNYTFNLLRSEK